MPSLISRLYNFVNDKNNGIAITASRVDGELNQLVNTLNVAVIAQATTPSSPFEGMFWYDTTNKFLKEYRNGEWIIMGPIQIGTVMATTKAGDIWIDNSGSEIVFNVRNKANSAWIVLVQTTNTYLLPSGGIIKWYGSIASIPTGWFLCDGTNGTPDLRAKFIVGAGQDGGTYTPGIDGAGSGQYAPGATGGTDKHVLTIPEMPAHTHSDSAGSNGYQSGNNVPGPGAGGGQSTGSTGGGVAHDMRPNYYALAYIMKS